MIDPTWQSRAWLPREFRTNGAIAPNRTEFRDQLAVRFGKGFWIADSQFYHQITPLFTLVDSHTMRSQNLSCLAVRRNGQCDGAVGRRDIDSGTFDRFDRSDGQNDVQVQSAA